MPRCATVEGRLYANCVTSPQARHSIAGISCVWEGRAREQGKAANESCTHASSGSATGLPAKCPVSY